MVGMTMVKYRGTEVSFESRVSSDKNPVIDMDGIEIMTGAMGYRWNTMLFEKFRNLGPSVDKVEVTVRYGTEKVKSPKTFEVHRSSYFGKNKNRIDPDAAFSKYMAKVDKLVETGKANIVSVACGDTELVFTFTLTSVKDVVV